MNEFDELEAMKKIAAALEPLDAAARARALQWAVSRFHGSGAPMAIGSLALANERGGEPAISGPFGSFAELFDAASLAPRRTRRSSPLIGCKCVKAQRASQRSR